MSDRRGEVDKGRRVDKMDFLKYKISAGNRDHFKNEFRKLMNVEVKTTIILKTINALVEPIGELPIGFILSDKGDMYLAGYTSSRKRTYLHNLQPWREPTLNLYGGWTRRVWKNRDLYKYITMRLHQLKDHPNMISSSNTFESSRQALFTVVSLLENKNHIKTLCLLETRLMESLMRHNQQLLRSTCYNLKISVDINGLKKYIEKQYETPLSYISKEDFEKTGILLTTEDYINQKWHV